MFKTFKNAFKIPELRSKILFTLFIIILYRIGSVIPVPFTNVGELGAAYSQTGILTYLSMLSGSAFAQGTLFALGVSPYITAQIVIQLLTIAIPALERLAQNGEDGRKKINKITRYVTVLLSVITGIGYYLIMENQYGLVKKGYDNAFGIIVIIACYVAGASIVMWLGEKITENGIGNGISLIIFAGIVSRFPSIATTIYENIKAGSLSYIVALIFVVVLVVVFGFIVLMNDAERRIPVQYAKRVVGRKMYGGQSTYIPIKVSMAGVIPIIFAMSIMMFPATIMQLFGKEDNWVMRNIFSSSSWIYIVLYFLLILFFTFFYTKIQFNTIEIANNMKNNGGSIRGIRPGKPTSDYIDKSLNKITMAGAVFIGLVAVVPMILAKVFGLGGIAIGGTSLLIVVGVILETGKQIESQMMMRNYKGFLE